MMKRCLTFAFLFALPCCTAAGEGTESADGGRGREEAIIAGRDANISESPWQVSLQVAWDQAEPDEYDHFCGGSILDERNILTAQHCFVNYTGEDEVSPYAFKSPALVRVAAGSSELSRFEELGQIRKIEDIIPIAGFDELSLSNDIVIVRLAEPLRFDENVKPIAIATPDDAKQGLTAPGVVASVTGWGMVAYDGEADESYVPDRLQQVNLPIVSNEVAAAAYAELFSMPDWAVTDGQLAAGYMSNRSESPCYGDSGGPLVVAKGSGTILAGVVSYAPDCNAEYPSVYARVSSFNTFINQMKKSRATSWSRPKLSGTKDGFKYTEVSVPPGRRAFNIQLSGDAADGDADLYVRFGSQPTDTEYNCRPYQEGPNEFCSISNPQGGRWQIGIRGYTDYSGVTLKVTIW